MNCPFTFHHRQIVLINNIEIINNCQIHAVTYSTRCSIVMRFETIEFDTRLKTLISIRFGFRKRKNMKRNENWISASLHHRLFCFIHNTFIFTLRLVNLHREKIARNPKAMHIGMVHGIGTVQMQTAACGQIRTAWNRSKLIYILAASNGNHHQCT